MPSTRQPPLRAAFVGEIDPSKLVDPVAITFKGASLLFARASGAAVTTIYYDVRNPDAVPGGADEWCGWQSLDLTELPPGSADPEPMLRMAGVDLVTLPQSLVPADFFPAPADAPFRVVTDQQTITCVRLSETGSLLLDRFVLVESPVSSDAAADASNLDGNPEDTDTQAERRYALRRILEVRYRRSGLKDVPDGPYDSLGTTNMVGAPFYEPTTELSVLPQIKPGGDFEVVLGPTKTGGKRFHFFVVPSSGASTITCASFPEDATGRVAITPGWPSFTITPATVDENQNPVPLSCKGPVGACVYQELEQVTGAGGAQSTLRRGQRMVLAIPVSYGSEPATGLAVYDFMIQLDGTLPVVPVKTLCLPLDGTLSSGVAKFSPKSPAPASYPVTTNAITVVGAATLAATFLGQLEPASRPFLLNGADGLVHCYFAGPPAGGPSPLQVAWYDPLVRRAAAAIYWSASTTEGMLLLTSTRAGTTMEGLWVTCTPDPTYPDLCQVVIDYGDASGLGVENWYGVPRDIRALTAILEGGAGDDPDDPAVQSRSVPFYDYSGTLAQARLPLTTEEGTAYLTLLAHRPDVTLSSATVTAPAEGRAILTLTFELPLGAPVKQTWSAVPASSPALLPVLAGTAPPAVYGYEVGSDDDSVFAITTSGGTVLGFAAAGAKVELKVSRASDRKPLHCNVTIGAGSTKTVLQNIPRSQEGFIHALRDSTENPFRHLSPDPTDGQVADQHVGAPLDLRGASILFDLVAPPAAGTLQAATAPASVLQGHQLIGAPEGAPLDRVVALAISSPVAPPPGTTAIVTHASKGIVTPYQNGAWQAAPATQAASFAGGQAISVPLSTSWAGALAPGPRITMEAWVQPASSAAVLVAYNAAPSDELAAPTYLLGIVPDFTLSFPTPPAENTYVSLGGPLSTTFFDPTSFPSFTLEVWVRPSQSLASANVSWVIYEIDADLQGGAWVQRYLSFQIDGSGCPQLWVATDGEGGSATATSTLAVEPEEWSHVAVVGTNTGTSAPSWTVTFYVNGAPTEPTTGLAFLDVTANVGSNALPIIGTYAFRGGQGGYCSLPGSLNELRIWSVARTQADIQSTMNVPLTGSEPALQCYWPFTDTQASGGKVTDLGPNALNGTIKGTGITQTQTGVLLAVAAGLAGAPPVLAGSFPADGAWVHVAATCEVVGGLSFAPPPPGSPLPVALCSRSGPLQMQGAATLEAWVKAPPTWAATSTICGIWGAGAQAYRLGINQSGGLRFEITLSNTETGQALPYHVDAPVFITDDELHHVAAAVNFVGPAGSAGQGYYLGVTLFVDGVVRRVLQVSMTSKATVVMMQPDVPFTVGLSAYVPPGGAEPIVDQAPLNGVVSGIRLWNKTLDAPAIAAAMAQGPAADLSAGVVAAFWFTEQNGFLARDSVGGNALTLNAPSLWVPVPTIGYTTIYVNGTASPATAQAPAAIAGAYGTRNGALTLGAYGASAPVSLGLQGSLAEVRLWDVVRTPEQIASTMNRPLLGTEAGLKAYWRLDGNAADGTGQGNDGVAVPGGSLLVFVSSTAPVAAEGPAVLNAYGGIATAFQQPTAGAPAVWELASVHSASGAPRAAGLQRAYAFVSSALATTTTFGVGELEAVYLGQVQTSPTLLGYIEGAPPVPSENLTRPLYQSAFGYNAYADSATIRLVAETGTEVTGNAAFKKEGSEKLKFAYAGEGETRIDFGAFTIAQVADAKFKHKVKVGTELKEASASAYQDGSAGLVQVTDMVGLRGAWEPPQPSQADYLNPTVGRRYLPDNTGYALVESLVADLFSLQMKGTGVMYGRTLVPAANGSGGKVANILRFQISPAYVKNGTLDGKVGFVNDPDYPDAHIHPGSYFKPREAARLAALIAQDAAERRARALSWKPVGNTAISPSPRKRAVANAGEPVASFDDGGGATPQRGLANTYVWSAWGGLHREEESFTASQETSFTGEFTGKIGGALETEGKAVALFGAAFDLDLALDVALEQTSSVEVTDSLEVALRVTVTGEPFLQAYDQDRKEYSEGPAPGKVESYRFMSFYLPPASDNASDFLAKVVDRSWLENSSDPNAIALRSAVIEGNKVWRVLHRVTYVNRVPPTFDSNPAQQPGAATPTPIVTDDDLLLIALAQGALSGSPSNRANLGAALESAITELGAYAPWWHELVAAASASPGTPEANFVMRTRTAAMSYLLAGFMNGQLPLGVPATIQPRPLRGRKPRWGGKRASMLPEPAARRR